MFTMTLMQAMNTQQLYMAMWGALVRIAIKGTNLFKAFDA